MSCPLYSSRLFPSLNTSSSLDLQSLQKSTHHMISTPQFSQMKDGVVIINTARGAVIDEAALVKALEDGKVFSAGLDVYEDVMLLPHMGTWTVSGPQEVHKTC